MRWPEANGGGALTDINVAGADGNFVSDDAKIDGNTVMVSNARVANPTGCGTLGLTIWFAT